MRNIHSYKNAKFYLHWTIISYNWITLDSDIFASDNWTMLIAPNPVEVSSFSGQNKTFPNFLSQWCCLLKKSYNYDVTTIELLSNKKSI